MQSKQTLKIMSPKTTSFLRKAKAKIIKILDVEASKNSMEFPVGVFG